MDRFTYPLFTASLETLFSRNARHEMKWWYSAYIKDIFIYIIMLWYSGERSSDALVFVSDLWIAPLQPEQIQAILNHTCATAGVQVSDSAQSNDCRTGDCNLVGRASACSTFGIMAVLLTAIQNATCHLSVYGCKHTDISAMQNVRRHARLYCQFSNHYRQQRFETKNTQTRISEAFELPRVRVYCCHARALHSARQAFACHEQTASSL